MKNMRRILPVFFVQLLLVVAAYAQAKRPSVSWIFCGALMVIAVAVMLADAALTPEQRLAVFMQAGHFP